MGFLLPFLMAAGTGLSVFGQLQAGQAEEEAGKARQRARDYEAAQLYQSAGQVVASSQRAAQEERRQARFASSRALAVAAASGAGTSGTVKDIIADIAGEGAYRASVALYEGEERARQLRMDAQAMTYTGQIEAIGGEQRQKAYQIGAFGSLLSGAGNLYEKYWMGKPAATQPQTADMGYDWGG